eukprot:TRINITY_DN8099_c0_g1_i1.p1 TRINITY_DN8099_c0_g1~~TRINITY_DN8099_c0_g1_i1.p1  ORF type:complete len:358 (+),score=74.99 TRINITY_DN8099_c0_g1_i1:202-1275(+)
MATGVCSLLTSTKRLPASPASSSASLNGLLTMDTASSTDVSSRSSPTSTPGGSPFDTLFEATSATTLPQVNLTSLRALSDDDLAELNTTLSKLSPVAILSWLFQQDLGKIVQFTSFGISGMVITDVASKLGVNTPIVFVDTLHHFDETLKLKDRAAQYYSRQVLSYTPQTASTRQEFERLYGEELWKKDPDFYSYMTKIEPTGRALKDLEVDVWLTGRRRSQGSSRSDLHVIEVASDGRIKCNPMAWVPWAVTRQYIEQYSVPYNSLLNNGYKSVGDFHSTVPVGQDAPERSGRWSGDFRTECGMHTAFGRRKSSTDPSPSSSPGRTSPSTTSSSAGHKALLRLGAIEEDSSVTEAS